MPTPRWMSLGLVDRLGYYSFAKSAAGDVENAAERTHLPKMTFPLENSRSAKPC